MTDTTNSSALPSLLRMMVSAGARHLVTAVAGSLVTAGAIQSDQQTQFVTIATGVVVWAAGLAWSYANKKAVKDAAIPFDPAADPPH